MENKSTNLLTRLALLIALSVVASYIPIPSPTGTIALDSTPGYFAAISIGGFEGGIVLFFGHIFTSLKSGFPLGVIHLIIAFLMGGCGIFISYFKRKFNLIIAAILTVVLNSFILPLLLIPVLGYGFFTAMLLPLFFGSIVNIFISVILYKILSSRVEGIISEK